MSSMDEQFRELVAAEFVKNIEEAERASGMRRDLILDGMERAVKRLRKARPLH